MSVILKYSSEEYSDISRRFTDLFAGVFAGCGICIDGASERRWT